MPVENRVVQQAYKYALAPTPRQGRQFLSHAGGARFAYNWGIARVADALDAREAEKQAGVEKPTTKVPGHFDLCKAWTRWKDTAEWTDRRGGEVTIGVPWVGNNYSGTYQAALRDAHMAWQRFFNDRKKTGRRSGRPRFKKRGKSKTSFQVHGDGLQVVDGKHVKVPKIGVVRTHESTRKIGRRLRKGDVPCPECKSTGIVPAATAGKTKTCPSCKGRKQVPTARIVRGTASQDSSGRWFLSLTVEVVRQVRTGPSARQTKGGPVGIDLGVRDTATLSTGEVIGNPQHLEKHQRQLRAAQQALSRCQQGSKRREDARRRVARLHARVRNLRADSVAKAATGLVHGHSVIAVEGWDVQQTAQHGSKDVPGRVRRDRNRALADTALGKLRWQVETRAGWYGATVVVTGRHAPTGRQCSACGTVKAKPVPPTQDEFCCSGCGLVVDRRVNSARVLAAVATGLSDAPSGGESVNARGGGVSPVPRQRGGRSSVKREARARPSGRGETGAPGP